MAESEGISTRYLLGAFFAVVLLCAVFFSLGYFLGYREGRPSGASLLERVSASSDSPAPVNPSSSSGSAADSSSGQNSETPNDPDATAQSTGNPEQAGSSAAPPVNSPAAKSTSSAATQASQIPAGAAPSPASSPPAEPDASAAVDRNESTSRSVPSGVLIQVGAVISRQQAFNMQEGLRSRGYPSLVLTPQQLHAGDSFYRVVAGPYRTREAAGVALRKLMTQGYKPFIRQ